MNESLGSTIPRIRYFSIGLGIGIVADVLLLVFVGDVARMLAVPVMMLSASLSLVIGALREAEHRRALRRTAVLCLIITAITAAGLLRSFD
jgi:glucose-6-phosphate-specific signal transduction histidine kinase